MQLLQYRQKNASEILMLGIRQCFCFHMRATFSRVPSLCLLPVLSPCLINVKPDNVAAEKEEGSTRLMRASVSQHKHLGAELMSRNPEGGGRTN